MVWILRRQCWEAAFFCGDSFCPPGDENGFLLVMPPGPADHGGIGNPLTGAEDGADALCVDKALFPIVRKNHLGEMGTRLSKLPGKLREYQQRQRQVEGIERQPASRAGSPGDGRARGSTT